MADSSAVTGSKDDLAVDSSRCQRMRFSGSSCRRCVDICPHGAATLNGGLSIDPQQCRGCLLCTAVCPTGALEQSNDFLACLAQLSKVPEPTLGCIRTNECSNAALACLGGLSGEHLAALCFSLSGKLTLNLSACGGCPNSRMIPLLQQRLDKLAESGLSGGGCQIVIVESAQDIRYCDESVDRRGFFKSLRSSLFQGTAVMLSAGNEQAEHRTEYAEKRLPARRGLLNRTAGRLSSELGRLVLGLYGHQIAFSGNCTTCQGCVAICPTGALLIDSPDDPPQFDPQRCTGCGLCVEFCLDGALRLYST